jgi:DNA-binding MarR family transcriptional regulator
MASLLAQLNQNLALPKPHIGKGSSAGRDHPGRTLPRLSDHVKRRLMELTMAQGHPNLKLSFAQVLMLIGPNGGRIGQMARLQEVSKQAISAVAGELERLGYIKRRSDGRQSALLLTDAGMTLLADSVTSIEVLEAQFSDVLGHEALAELKHLAAQLYHTLHIDDEVFPTGMQVYAGDLKSLALALQRQLGETASKELALLLNQGDARQ